MGAIGILAEIFRNKTGRTIGFVFLIVAVLLFVFSISKKRDHMAKLPVISMLEGIQTMERLELLSYQATEVLVLGDPDVLQKMVTKTVVDSAETYQQIKHLSHELEKTNVEHASVSHSQRPMHEELTELEEQADSAASRYQAISEPFKKWYRNAKKQSVDQLKEEFGQSLADAWTSYQNALNLEESSEHSKKKHHRKARKAAEHSLEKSWLQIKKDRLDKWTDLKKQVDHKKRSFKHSTGQKRLKYLNKKINDHQTQLTEKKKNLADARLKIYHLKKTIVSNHTENVFEVENPRLLAILPTRSSLYLDLSTTKTHISKDSTVFIQIDSLHFSPVNIMVDSSQHFNVAQREIQIRKEEGGLYFEVFEQLQMGLAVVAERVKTKLRAPRLKKLALKKASSYFRNIYQPLGYKVQLLYGNSPTAHEAVSVHEEKDLPEILKHALPKDHAFKRTMSSANGHGKNQAKTVVDTMKGIDVSRWQGQIDWEMVATQNIDFAYTKATQGLGYTDAQFERNWTNISKTKIRKGAYHFFHPVHDPKAQADFFIHTVGSLTENDLPPMLDLEGSSIHGLETSEFVQNVLTWIKTVEQHYGVAPIIYSNPSFSNRYLTNPEFSKYKLWIASYSEGHPPAIPSAWEKSGWYMWQFTSHDKVKGIKGHVDVDWMKVNQSGS